MRSVLNFLACHGKPPRVPVVADPWSNASKLKTKKNYLLDFGKYLWLMFFGQHKGPFPLRAKKHSLFVLLLFFCARFNFNRSLQSKINKREKEWSFPRS